MSPNNVVLAVCHLDVVMLDHTQRQHRQRVCPGIGLGLAHEEASVLVRGLEQRARLGFADAPKEPRLRLNPDLADIAAGDKPLAALGIARAPPVILHM